MSNGIRDEETLLTGWSHLEPGQSVIVRAQSPLYKGEYVCSVLERTGERLRISMPMDNGRLVLVPVGTIVTLAIDTPAGPVQVRAQVVDRRAGRERSLLLGPEPQPPRYLQAAESSAPGRTIAVTSGKGGVGKTVFAINLGLALAELGKRVCIIDGDLGTANVDVLLNLTPHYNLAHVIAGEKNIFEVVMQGPDNLIVLPGGSGLQELTWLDERQFGKLLAQFSQLERYVDVMLLDTGSGLSRSVTNFVRAADETIIVTTPEPHAITDAYALIKVSSQDHPNLTLQLVVNRVQDEAEAREIARKMTFASQQFLETDLRFLGHVVEDQSVGKSVRMQQALLSALPRSRAAACVRAIAYRLAHGVESAGDAAAGNGESGPASRAARGRQPFLQRVRHLFSR